MLSKGEAAVESVEVKVPARRCLEMVCIPTTPSHGLLKKAFLFLRSQFHVETNATKDV